MSEKEPAPVTDWDLHAYADGRIDPETDHARAVEAYLAANPAEQSRVRAYRAQDEAIRARYRHVLAQPVPERLRPESLRAARAGIASRRPSLRAAAGVALLVCATLIGWLAGQQSDRPLERFADRTTAYLSAQQESGPSGSPAELESLSALGGAPDFRTKGLELVGARELDNGDMYEARYRDRGGRELRLFVAPDPQRHDILMSRTADGGRKVVYWQQGPLMYGLTGDFDEGLLDDFAHTAINQFRDRLDTNRLADTGDDAGSSSTRDTSPATGQITSAEPEADRLDPRGLQLNSDALDLRNRRDGLTR